MLSETNRIFSHQSCKLYQFVNFSVSFAVRDRHIVTLKHFLTDEAISCENQSSGYLEINLENWFRVPLYFILIPLNHTNWSTTYYIHFFFSARPSV